MTWMEHVARKRMTRNACRILVGKPAGNSLLGRYIYIYIYAESFEINFK